MAVEANYENWGLPGNRLGPTRVGPDIASAATIAPTHPVHVVTGAAAIVNITPPWVGFCGFLVLVAAGAFTWTAAGNIALASALAQTVGKAVVFFYNPVTGKWSPVASAAT